MYLNNNHRHQHQHQQQQSASLLLSSPTKFKDQACDVSSLGQVVKKFNGLIDSSNFLQSDKSVEQTPPGSVAKSVHHQRSEPIDIPKPGQRLSCEDQGWSSSRAEDPFPSCEIDDVDFVTSQIAEQIEAGIKRAKGSALDCSEVLIPLNLMQQIAADIISSSIVEPTGLRGCLLFIGLEDHSKEYKRIGCLRPIGHLSNPVPTFELYLTLKQAQGGWLNAVSSKVLKMGRKSLVISDQYQLSKKKLFRSDLYS